MTKALYVHVPFCTKICAYCDFFRVVAHPQLIAQYLGSLKVELAAYPHQQYQTIYIGGGTPTSLNEKELTILFEILKPVAKQTHEYTIEINPESLTLAKVKIMRNYGINRVSLGIQTFDENELKLLHRFHTIKDIKQAIDLLTENGITNISIDFIYGLPLQTLESFTKSIHEAFKYPITHLSLYSLTIEPHSEFGRQGVKKVTDEIEEEMYFKAIDMLKSYGFHQYEISNFTKNQPALHNCTYWHYEDYIGLGPGAVSLYQNQRIENTKNLLDYFNGKFHASVFDLSKDEQRYEFVMMGLRLKEGIELKRYTDYFGDRLEIRCASQIKKLIDKGWLDVAGGYLKATEAGFPLLNTVLGELLDD